MPYSKHTNMELLAASCNCIGDSIRTDLEHGIRRPKAILLLEELRKRTDGVTFVTDEFPSPAEWVKHHRKHDV